MAEVKDITPTKQNQLKGMKVKGIMLGDIVCGMYSKRDVNHKWTTEDYLDFVKALLTIEDNIKKALDTIESAQRDIKHYLDIKAALYQFAGENIK